jgi:hypothetical protein
LFLEVRHCDLE